MKIIFLDFDGVLKNAAAASQDNYLDIKCVQRLQEIVDVTGAKIVFSTSWRLGVPFIKLISMLSQMGLNAEFAGVTPILMDSTQNRRGIPHAIDRWQEIEAWLNAMNGKIDSFLILEDHEDMTQFASNAIMTNPKIGLVDDDVQRAITILGKK